jgi:hypothetical protein
MTINIKLVPFTARAAVDPTTITAVTVTPDQRGLRPLPPGNVAINGVHWPTSVTGDAVMTWNHRNRKGPFVVPQDAADYSAGPEGDYTIEILVNAVSIRTVTAVTGTTYTYTAAQRAIDDANPAHTVEIKITPVNADALAGTTRSLGPFLMS